MLTVNSEQETVARPPTRVEVRLDQGFWLLTVCFAVGTILLLAFILFEITRLAWPAFGEFGFRFFTSSTWDAVHDRYGILPAVAGTVYTSALALIIGGILGVGAAVFLSQGYLPRWLERVMKNLVELLAAIPSVVYGLWGIFVLIPLIRPACNWLYHHHAVHFAAHTLRIPLVGWVIHFPAWTLGIPFFKTPLSGVGILPASLVLAIMILPTVTAISREAMVAVPSRLKEAAFGLGATRWQAIRKVVIPTAGTGIFGSLVLAFGRALGETMALAMLVGNSNQFGWSLFSPGNTIAALIANNMGEAQGKQVAALMYAALVLLFITLAVNVIGALIVNRATADFGEVR